MKVLVATTEKQGRRKNDFAWAEEGELVCMTMECDGEDVDGECGCRRAFSGTVSHKATTTAKVVEQDITKDEFRRKIKESFDDGGWNLSPNEVFGMADELLDLARHFPAGMVIEKRGDTLKERV